MTSQGGSNWRRNPIGAGLSVMNNRQKPAAPRNMRRGWADTELDEYEDQLRESGASEHLIKQEMDVLKRLQKENEEMSKNIKSRYKANKDIREGSKSVNPYIAAERRRQSKDGGLEDILGELGYE